MKTFGISLAQRTANKINFFFVAGAAALYFAVCLQVPITKNLAFLNYQFNSSGNSSTFPTTQLKVGLFGYCTQQVGKAQSCVRGTPFLIELSGLPGRTNPINPFVVGKLVIPVAVLFPIATAAAFAAMLTAFVQGPLNLLFTQLAAVLGQAAMIIMFILYERTDQQIRQAYPQAVGGLGPALWMALAAALSAGMGLLFSIMGTAGVERRHGSLIEKPVYV